MTGKTELDMTPRDALEYARMCAAFRLGAARLAEVHQQSAELLKQLADAAGDHPPFKRPRTSAAIERAMTDEEIAAVVAGKATDV